MCFRLGSWKIYISRSLMWLRYGDKHVVMLTNAPLLFSERNGHVRYTPLPFGWRLKLKSTGVV